MDSPGRGVNGFYARGLNLFVSELWRSSDSNDSYCGCATSIRGATCESEHDALHCMSTVRTDK